MSIEHETTADELDALRDASGGFDARALSSGNPNGGSCRRVSAGQCHDWRQRVADGTTLVAIAAESDVTADVATVGYHANGKCSHNTGMDE